MSNHTSSNVSTCKDGGKDQELKLVLVRMFEQTGEALVISGAGNRIIAANNSFTRLTGYSREEVCGRSFKTLAPGLESKELFAVLRKTLLNGKRFQGKFRIKHKDGSIHPVWLTMTALRNDRGEIVNCIAQCSDISERKQAELKIEYLAHHDSLTKLLNRFSLEQRLCQSLGQAKRDGHNLAVLFIDLDRFKEVNDSLGHNVGDMLLMEVAARLVATVRGSDITARLGGDEFVVVLPHIQSVIDPAYLANKIQRTLSRPYLLAGHEVYNTPSIGIGVYPHDGNTAEELLKSADTAMYHAKSRGRNNYQFFMQEMHSIAQERLLLEHDLRLAVERNEFVFHFQPQIDLVSGVVTGVKAMLRWQHPVRGIITPDRFISIADASGLILQIDHLCLEMACRQLATWKSESLPMVRIAVKLSAKQFRQRTLPDKIAGIISKAEIDPRLLELEITESATMGNPDETICQLERLSKIGLELSIDNFGAGYSSLSYVRRFPVRRLIIDRSFVKGIESNIGDAAIVAATISLAHSLGKQVTAKGIETEAQFSFVSRQQCDIAQGYYFSRPLPADTIVEFIRNGIAVSAKGRKRAFRGAGLGMFEKSLPEKTLISGEY